MKVDVLWVNQNQGSSFAHNIMYVYSPGSTDQVSSTDLATVCNALLPAGTQQGFKRLLPSIGNSWKLQQVTTSDNGGSTNFSVVSGAYTGSNATYALPPQVAVCLSWTINARYRGGKPRTYLPGIPVTAQNGNGNSTLNPTYASTLVTEAQALLADANAVTVGSFPVQLGTISYQTGHSTRPTPLFRPFLNVHVHERLDSQRRRSGKEANFPVA